LGDYAKNFNTDLDVLWNQADVDNNGMLDRVECKNFMDQVVSCISAERAENYHRDDFDALFDKYDDDKNGYIEKHEMAVFIKQTFRTRCKQDGELDCEVVHESLLDTYINE